MVEVLDRIAECASRPRRATLAASASQGSSIFRIFVEPEFSSFRGSEFICLATPPDPYRPLSGRVPPLSDLLHSSFTYIKRKKVEWTAHLMCARQVRADPGPLPHTGHNSLMCAVPTPYVELRLRQRRRLVAAMLAHAIYRATLITLLHAPDGVRPPGHGRPRREGAPPPQARLAGRRCGRQRRHAPRRPRPERSACGGELVH